MKRCLVAFLLLLGTGFSAEPSETPSPFPAPSQQIIGSEKTFALGELVDLSVKLDGGSVASSTDWVMFELPSGIEKKFKFYRETTKSGLVEGIVWGAGTESKEILVVCCITRLDVSKDKDVVKTAGTHTQVLRAKIVIGDGSSPRPGPGPGPLVNPDKKFPNEKFGLSTKVFKVVSESGPATGKKTGSAALVVSFRGIQASIVAGALKEPSDILKKSAAANLSAVTGVGLKREDWLNVFTSIQDELFSLYEKGKVVTPAQFGDAFSEIADGFEALR